MASLYSEADLSKHPPLRTGIDAVLTESVVSAEGVALSLLKLFGEKHLPRASELRWLVSEQEAPQQVPNNFVPSRPVIFNLKYMCPLL